MNNRSEKVLKAFLSRCPPKEREALERFLPDSERQFLNELPPFDASVETNHEMDSLDGVHWSWLVPIIESSSTREQKLYLSALDDHAAESIAKALGIGQLKEKPSELARGFLRGQLIEQLVGNGGQILPSEYLPTSELNRLLHLSKKDLIKTIDYLALYDLSIEFRQIVETKILKKIYSFLSEEQKNLLQQITSGSEANPFGRLGLDRWDETAETLRALLHRRGLTRLGAALSGQEPDLVWTLCHRLDVGRGGALFKLYTKEAVAGVSELARRQIEELMGKLGL